MANSAQPKKKPLPGGLSVLQLFALSKAIKDAKDWREFLPVGDGQPFDFAVRLKGKLNAASSQTSKVKVPPELEAVLGIMLDLVDEEEGKRLSDQIVNRYAAIVDPVRSEEISLGAGRRAREVVALLTVEKDQKKAGNVTVTVDVEKVPLSAVKKPPYKGRK